MRAASRGEAARMDLMVWRPVSSRTRSVSGSSLLDWWKGRERRSRHGLRPCGM